MLGKYKPSNLIKDILWYFSRVRILHHFSTSMYLRIAHKDNKESYDSQNYEHYELQKYVYRYIHSAK